MSLFFVQGSLVIGIWLILILQIGGTRFGMVFRDCFFSLVLLMNVSPLTHSGVPKYDCSGNEVDRQQQYDEDDYRDYKHQNHVSVDGIVLYLGCSFTVNPPQQNLDPKDTVKRRGAICADGSS